MGDVALRERLTGYMILIDRFDLHHIERRSYFGVIGVITPNRAFARKKYLVYQ
nr:MAG TPA: hypothetical protein [Caudoviricetes sp.]